MRKRGLVSVSFRNNSPKEILEQMKKAGLEYVEWGSDVHAPCDNDSRLNEIVKLQNDFGIKCISYGTYFRIGVNRVEEITGYIRAAKILKTDILRIWCGTKGFADYSKEELENIVNDCISLAQIAQESMVTLCLECHPGTVTDCFEGAQYIMNAVNSKSFAMYWQPNQYHSLDWNLRYAEKTAVYTKVIHTFYWVGDKNFSLADGAEIWQKYLKIFNKNIPCLLEFMPDGRIESLIIEATALKLITGDNK